MTTTTRISPKALRYKWEAYCNTNGRCTAIQMGRSTDSVSLSSERRGAESNAIQIGGVFQGRKTMTATDVTGFDAIFSTGFFATFSRF